MRKFVNGQYVPVEEAVIAVAGAVKAPWMDNASKRARELMQEAVSVDFSGLIGTGAGGQITVTDVKKYIEGAK